MDRTFKNQAGRAKVVVVAFAIVAMWATSNAYPVLAQESTQPTFSSAEEACRRLFEAVQSNDEQAIANVLGGPTELGSSRDEADDARDRDVFVQKYREMHRLAPEADGWVMLYIGAENWPFPVPLVAKNGAWRFDSEAGAKEVLFRRIGENELAAIDVCHDFVAAERQVRTAPNAADNMDGPLASLVSSGSESAVGGDPILFQGYYFKVIATRPKGGNSARTGGQGVGGLGVIAYPAEYRSSGVMTFVVTPKDIVYEKDLGPDTSTLAAGMRAFQKDGTWVAVDE